ncbi:HU family DNA-binding protein [Chitinilyticum piscinae]|uniref:Viral histone-like protein n=1 Tax=Chitinilyticum piscinae TaxID=2866724 RepID=A0A8J7FNK5_9NEIS|nr:HU family DNA-binding protein [Chitinilyticum piscinae]MBE9610710.1 HU family DNA-binding protein [Chitinilyticum piscinae]
MNKRDLIEAVRLIAALENPDIDRKTVTLIFDALAEVGTATLKGGGELPLPGLGKLAVQQRAARMGRNPRTGEPVTIPAKRTLKYTPLKNLKDELTPADKQ